MPRMTALGSAERAVLAGLYANGGTWSASKRPLWESRHWTLRILAALTRRGLVREVVPDVQYEITKEGERQVTNPQPTVVQVGITKPTSK